MTDLVSVGGFVLAVVFVVINGVTQLVYAQSLGYRIKPTGFAYLIGAVGNLLTGSVVPISAQAETLTMGGLIKDIRTRVGAFLIAASVGIVLGLTGTIGRVVDFAGETVVFGMMAGVGLILSETALSMIKQEKRIGLLSIVFGIVVWIAFHDVVLTIAISVLIPTLDFALIQKRIVLFQEIPTHAVVKSKKSFFQEIQWIKPSFNAAAVFAGLGIICLNIGSNISFGSITAGMAGGDFDVNVLTVINSLADIPSILFGGMPLEAIISGTASAKWPVAAGIAMMTVSAAIVLMGVVAKLGKYIPSQSIAGFLLVIGFFLTLIPNFALISQSDSKVEGFVAAGVTMLTKNAFFGLIAGIATRFLTIMGGML